VNPFEVVSEFEQVVAEYADAPYGVAVDSCTNALFLSLKVGKMKYGGTNVMLPKYTYVGVAHAAVNAGYRVLFIDFDWRGAYTLAMTNVVDSARRFREGMYVPGTLYCVSFHSGKHLPLESGGMILLDNVADYVLLKRMRYDGRTEMVPPKEDTFDVPGYHCLMHPSIAVRGLQIMHYMPDYNDDLPMDEYADLSQFPYFTEANR
jgi:dTDP-4-amino-4,6-dideoxygalactose transaminase